MFFSIFLEEGTNSFSISCSLMYCLRQQFSPRGGRSHERMFKLHLKVINYA